MNFWILKESGQIMLLNVKKRYNKIVVWHLKNWKDHGIEVFQELVHCFKKIVTHWLMIRVIVFVVNSNNTL